MKHDDDTDQHGDDVGIGWLAVALALTFIGVLLGLALAHGNA